MTAQTQFTTNLVLDHFQGDVNWYNTVFDLMLEII